PGFRFGSVLDVTVPWITVSPVTDVVLNDAVVDVPVLQAIVAVNPFRPLDAQLPFVAAGLGVTVTLPVTAFVGRPGEAVLPTRQPVSFTPLIETLSFWAFVVSPGLMVAEPLTWHTAPRAAECAGWMAIKLE